MIPLRVSRPVPSFPWLSVLWLLLWLGMDLWSRWGVPVREDFLMQMAFVPSSWEWRRVLTAPLFHAQSFALVVTLIFSWAFTPHVWSRSPVRAWVVGFSGVLVAMSSYRMIFPHLTQPIFVSSALLGAWLGMFMKRNIWGAMDTLVVGWGWIRVLEVPAYVLLFFWLFYLLIGNLLTKPPFADAPLFYWIPCISFLWGFVLETVWDILKAWMLNSSNAENSDVNKSS